MEAYASIRCEGVEYQYQLTALEVAQLVAYRNGFSDLDVEPGTQGIKITADGRSRTVTANGKTTEQAVERLIKEIHNV